MRRCFLRWLPWFASLVWSGSALAAGFAVQNQNASGTANAFAGAGAVAEDASTIFFNPAGMTYLPRGHSISLAGTLLHRKLAFDNRNSSQVNGLIPLGENGGDAGGDTLIPAGYWAWGLSPSLWLGIGVSAPFGNKTEWEENFMGRYQGTFSDIQSININPSVAYKATDRISLGFGVSHMKLEAELRSMAPIIVGGPTYLGDATVKLEGDDSDWGWNAGAMFQVTPETRIGLTYRSKVEFHVTGTVAVSSDFAPTSRQNVNVDIELPDTLSLSFFTVASDRWEIMGDVTWTGWDSIPALVVKNSGGTTLSEERLDFKDSWRVGLGANYRLDDAWKLRMGVAYDRSPVRDDESRTVRLPDSDRTWLAFGARYTFSPNSSLDFGYAHIFFKDSGIDRQTLLNGVPTAQFLRGDFDTSADLFSIQYNASF